MTNASPKLSANAETGNLADRLRRVRGRLARAVAQSGRTPHSVLLLAASKAQPPETIRAAYALGLREFGENYVQEAVGKIAVLPDDIVWHFIGPLQSNKTAAVAAHFAWVHSVDRCSIARRLSAQRPAHLAPLNICLQVNISAEVSKSGFAPGAIASAYAQIRQLPRLRVRGLMAIPRASDTYAEQFAACDALRRLRDNTDPNLDCLSMGMSADLEAAVGAGATIVRIGTALFGPRTTKVTS